MDADLIDASICCGLLLAAGSGSRFRASASGLADAGLLRGKLLAPLPGSGLAVARASAMQLKRVLARVVAVIPEHDEALRHELALAGCEILVHPHAERGMGSTLAAGIRTISAGQRPPGMCLVALADMPWIQCDTIRRLSLLRTDAAIAAPLYREQRGHPVRFDAQLFGELSALDGDMGARSLMLAHAVHLMPCDDPGVIRDIDTVAQLGGSAD
ncbi:nucleotidyltransferase family protein [Paracandidimonas soli]|uniref:Molybdenum cofactor cytidylyltransferase n=1 Tax=Paracandidimonas soli TaxID=1917182 RepID=A0A4R3V603_9BURK|nr:nucleotidyltransferase family protein [Paracandidimonas soli]TCU99022.1 molybdenum cofactor cytidylyltransferase [Paracandidimonas soli]